MSLDRWTNPREVSLGALVEVDGGRNLAVGFRRLWPTAKEAAPS
jgi:hypothetical protein